MGKEEFTDRLKELDLEDEPIASEHDPVTDARTKKELAEVLGISRQSLYEWSQDPKSPGAGCLKVLPWREYQLTRKRFEVLEDNDPKKTLEQEKLQEEVRKLRNYNLEKEKQVISIQAVREAIIGLVSDLDTQIRIIETNLPQDLGISIEKIPLAINKIRVRFDAMRIKINSGKLDDIKNYGL